MLTSNMLIIQKIDLHTLAKYWHLIGNMHTNTKETYLVIGVQKRTLWVEKLLKDGLNYAKKKSVPLTLMIKRSSDVPQLDELAWSAASCQLPLLRFHFPSLFPLFFSTFHHENALCELAVLSFHFHLFLLNSDILSLSSDLGNGLVIFQVIFSTRICKTEVYMFWQIS